MNRISVVLLVLVVPFFYGCASIMEGSTQVVNIQTVHCEEAGPFTCTVTNDSGSSVLTAPASVNVEKDKDELTVSCASSDKRATGNIIVESGYEAMNAGNLLLGGFIGVGVDAATGAMWKYPAAVIVPMRCDGERVEGD